MIGKVDESGRAVIGIKIITDNCPDGSIVDVWIDTGFTGDVVASLMNKSIVRVIAWRPVMAKLTIATILAIAILTNIESLGAIGEEVTVTVNPPYLLQIEVYDKSTKFGFTTRDHESQSRPVARKTIMLGSGNEGDGGTFHKSVAISDRDALTITYGLDNYETLNLSWLNSFPAESICQLWQPLNAIDSKNVPQLKKLRNLSVLAFGVKSNSEFKEILEATPGLELLYAVGLPSAIDRPCPDDSVIDDSIFSEIAKLKKLKSIMIHSSQLTDIGISKIKDNANTLESIALAGYSKVKIDAFKHLSTFKSLRELIVETSEPITDDFILLFAKRLEPLERLSLTGELKVSDHFRRQFHQHSPNTILELKNSEP